ncbi:MAG TPA: flagellar basal-body rod protein FlgG [Terriglobia bacterium]|jgi:flagellar basal-body rod protein FlgG|nr:flagellar basal-body rod protein FlgG [Terriglobia bacterium]
MFRALYTAASGMNAQQLSLENIANNLANANTVGFRSRRLQFEDLMYQNVVVPGSAMTQQTTIPTGLQIGLGTRPASSEVIDTPGNLTSTGNQLDVAIQGNGYFQVLTPNGQLAYTRDGSFHLNQQRQIVTSDGNPLQPAITIPANATSVSIGQDGTVSVTEPNQTQAAQVGTIQLALFPNPGGLLGIGGNLYVPTTASGDPLVGTPGSAEGLGTLQQGMVEESNVSVVEQFIQMILAQRSYEANSKVVQAANQMLQQLNNVA